MKCPRGQPEPMEWEYAHAYKSREHVALPKVMSRVWIAVSRKRKRSPAEVEGTPSLGSRNCLYVEGGRMCNEVERLVVME